MRGGDRPPPSAPVGAEEPGQHAQAPEHSEAGGSQPRGGLLGIQVRRAKELGGLFGRKVEDHQASRGQDHRPPAQAPGGAWQVRRVPQQDGGQQGNPYPVVGPGDRRDQQHEQRRGGQGRGGPARGPGPADDDHGRNEDDGGQGQPEGHGGREAGPGQVRDGTAQREVVNVSRAADAPGVGEQVPPVEPGFTRQDQESQGEGGQEPEGHVPQSAPVSADQEVQPEDQRCQFDARRHSGQESRRPAATPGGQQVAHDQHKQHDVDLSEGRGLPPRAQRGHQAEDQDRGRPEPGIRQHPAHAAASGEPAHQLDGGQQGQQQRHDPEHQESRGIAQRGGHGEEQGGKRRIGEQQRRVLPVRDGAGVQLPRRVQDALASQPIHPEVEAVGRRQDVRQPDQDGGRRHRSRRQGRSCKVPGCATCLHAASCPWIPPANRRRRPV